VTKQNKRALSKATNSILNSMLHDTAVHYFNMNTEKPELKGLSEIRFGSMIFLFRMAGVPFQMKKMQTIYAVYMVTVLICSCSTFIGMSVDAYIHRDDLGRALTTIRVLIPITNIIWVFLNCR
jgi:hypothetical protein